MSLSVHQLSLREIEGTHRPAAKMLLAFPLLTPTAVTGPGRVSTFPMALQVELTMKYWATFETVLSARAMEPEAMRTSRVV